MLDSTVNLTYKVLRQPERWLGLDDWTERQTVTDLTANLQNISLEFAYYVTDSIKNAIQDSLGVLYARIYYILREL